MDADEREKQERNGTTGTYWWPVTHAKLLGWGRLQQAMHASCQHRLYTGIVPKYHLGNKKGHRTRSVALFSGTPSCSRTSRRHRPAPGYGTTTRTTTHQAPSRGTCRRQAQAASTGHKHGPAPRQADPGGFTAKCPAKYPTTCLIIAAARTGAPLRPPWCARFRLTANGAKATPWVPCIASRSVCPQSRIFSERCSGTDLAARTAVYQRFQLLHIGRTQVFTGKQGLRLRKNTLPRHARQEWRHGTRDETGHDHRQPVRRSIRHPCWPARRAAAEQTEQQTRQYQRHCALQRRRHRHLHGIPPAVSLAASLAINASAARQASPSGCRARMRAAAAWASA